MGSKIAFKKLACLDTEVIMAKNVPQAVMTCEYPLGEL